MICWKRSSPARWPIFWWWPHACSTSSRARSCPTGPTPDDEDEEDAGDALVRQLIEYRQFKEVAAQLRQREDEGLRVYSNARAPPRVDAAWISPTWTSTSLQRALRRALERIPDDPPLPRVKSYEITVAEQIENVRSYVESVQRRNSDGAGLVPFVDLLSRR
ncbi:MAG: segregation/condensation protein A [Caldilineaceae bacterium]